MFFLSIPVRPWCITKLPKNICLYIKFQLPRAKLTKDRFVGYFWSLYVIYRFNFFSSDNSKCSNIRLLSFLMEENTENPFGCMKYIKVRFPFSDVSKYFNCCWIIWLILITWQIYKILTRLYPLLAKYFLYEFFWQLKIQYNRSTICETSFRKVLI